MHYDKRHWVVLIATLCVGVACGDDAPADAAPVAVAGAAGHAGSSINPDAGCDPLEDRCSGSTYCQYTDGRLLCVPEGQNPRDERCPDGRCTRGSICMPAAFDGEPTCQQPCAEDHACFITRHDCFEALGADGEVLPFGLCRYVE